MSHKLLTLLIAALVFSVELVRAQNPVLGPPAGLDTADSFCHFDGMMQALDHNPAHLQMRRDFDRMVRQYISDNPADERGGNDIVIPVVFHVIYDGQDLGFGENISYERIVWQVNALNAAFGRNYPNYNGQSHDGSATNCHIRFCLATVPAGTTWTDNAEPGVMRYVGTSTAVLDPAIPDIFNNDFTSVMPLVNLTHPTPAHFPFNRYLNIWSVRSLGDALGVATPPQSANNYYPLDGVIVCSSIIGDNTITGNDFDMDFYKDEGKILAHEIGHYLDLLHTFHPDYSSTLPFTCAGFAVAGAPADACDEEGDHICDIPPCQVLTYTNQQDCNYTYNECTSTNNYPGHNYMTYMDDGCLNAFTQGQSTWMNAVLNNNLQNRFPLWQPANLNATGVNCSECYLTANIGVSPALPCPGALVDFTTPTGNAFCATQWNWQFPGSIQGSSTLQNPQDIVYPAAGVYTVTLTAGNGSSSVQEQFEITISQRVASITGPASPVAVCNGSLQTIEFLFEGGTPPYTYTLSNGTVFETWHARFNYVISVNDTVNISIVSAHDSICSAAVSGNVMFNASSCCYELIDNGSFTDGNAGFESDLPYTPSMYGPSQFFYSTGQYAQPPYYGWVAPELQDFGNGMSFNAPQTPEHTVPYLYTELWSQQVTLHGDINYHFNYLITNGNGNPSILSDRFIHLKVVVTDNAGNIVFSNDFTPDLSLAGFAYPGREYWCQQRAIINTTGFPDGNYTISIRQTGQYYNFSAVWYDFIIDEISLREELPHSPLGLTVSPGGCQGQVVTFTASPGFSNYIFMNGNQVVQNSSSNTYSDPGLASGSGISVSVASPGGCIVASQSVTYISNPSPVIPLGSDTAICGTATITLDAGAGYSSYLWSPGGETTQTITVGTGSYTAAVTDTNGCSGTEHILISAASYLHPVISPAGPLSFCEDTTVTLNAGAGYDTYLWSPGGETTQTIAVDAQGDYSVTVTGWGCSGSSAAVEVNYYAALSPVIQVNANLLCVADTFCTYQWIFDGGDIIGATSYCYDITESGMYAVEVSTCDGCFLKPNAVEVTYNGVDEQDFAEHILVYPNPTAGSLLLELTFVQPEDLVVRLLDVAGRELTEPLRFQAVSSVRKELPLTGLACGFYFLVLEKNDSRLVKKVIKK